jgi:flagellin-specific chaperone FliS
MLDRLTVANVTNDARVISEVTSLVQKLKTGWDQIVTNGR